VAIPPLNNIGLLPPGVHACSLDDIQPWIEGDLLRHRIWTGLVQVLPQMRAPFAAHAVPQGRLVLGGSFFSDKPNPADIEATIVLDASHPPALIGKMAELYYTSHAQWKADHLVDFYPTFPGPGQNDFSAFFQYVGVKTANAKGLQPNDLRGVVGLSTW
jgi:hypothetical protein